MIMLHIARSLIATGLIAILAACSSVPLDNQAEHTTSTTRTDGVSANQILDPFNPQSVLAQQRSVYFDFDSYTVSDQYKTLVNSHASYLATHTGQRVRVEGHTDPRGGAEYNLALGQRRAESVKEILTLNGVTNHQIETISLGKERASGTDETGWAHDRRADIVYQR